MGILALACLLANCGGSSGNESDIQSGSNGSSHQLLFIADNSVGPSPLIHTFQLDTKAGSLKEVGTPIDSVWARPLIIDPKGRFLYAGPIQTTAQTVLGYTIDAATGQLSPIPGSPFFSEYGGRLIVIDPISKFLYADGQAFSIDQNTGALSAFNTVAGITPAAITKDGIAIRFDCPSVGGPGTLASYRIDAAGNLVNLANVTLTCITGKVDVDPTGKFVYVSTAVFKLDPSTGAMIQTPGSFPISLLAFDPLGRFLYSSEATNPSAIDGLAIDPASGALTLVAGSPFTVQLGLGNAAVDPSGHFLVTALESTFSIDQTSGALSPVQPFVPLNTTAIAFYPPQK